MKDPGRILILGAGPTGLGAAWRLRDLGLDDYLMVEGRQGPGGLATSFVDEAGFTWDVGGHVQFSHYSYYDDVLDHAVTGGWLEHERESWVWIRERWVPYPFQYNIHRLPDAERDRGLAELERASAAAGETKPENFREWILQTFGSGIADSFLFPYNFKVWGHPLETMGVDWMGERVAVPDVERVRRNIREMKDDVSWGPNNRFRFPLHGGTGAIWISVAGRLPEARQRYGAWAEAVDLDARTLRLAGGEKLSWDKLITTLPLDTLWQMCEGREPALDAAADALTHSTVHILGVGLKGAKPETLAKKCWMYFPEEHSPYYRVTVFTNYSPNNAPQGDGYWSLMAEVCESSHKPVDAGDLERWTVEAMRRDGLLEESTEVVSFWHHREEHGYPTPFLGRDQILDKLIPWLEKRDVYSRGRFGAWKYEVSNQDHSFMQGVEVVDRLVGQGDEPTLNRSDYVNGGAFLRSPA